MMTPKDYEWALAECQRVRDVEIEMNDELKKELETAKELIKFRNNQIKDLKKEIKDLYKDREKFMTELKQLREVNNGT